jgi:hypothetical protein
MLEPDAAAFEGFEGCAAQTESFSRIGHREIGLLSGELERTSDIRHGSR